jgi:ElaB/YqjD/DUF883 family membrane-anchored ribosome-binding protein
LWRQLQEDFSASVRAPGDLLKKGKTMTTVEANERLASDLRAAIRDAEELMKGNQDGDQPAAVRSRISTALESAKATYQRLQDKTVAAAKATDRVIRDHPYESIGVAFGVGLLVGFLVARK